MYFASACRILSDLEIEQIPDRLPESVPAHMITQVAIRLQALILG